MLSAMFANTYLTYNISLLALSHISMTCHCIAFYSLNLPQWDMEMYLHRQIAQDTLNP